MKDIAHDLGVSLMTVSKALRNHSDISQQTRDRVLKRMRELNYQPDWVARTTIVNREPRGFEGHLLDLSQAGRRLSISSTHQGIEMVRH